MSSFGLTNPSRRSVRCTLVDCGDIDRLWRVPCTEPGELSTISGMSVRRRAVIGLLAVASLVLTGCAGDGPDEDPGESQITLPPEESTPSSAETVLDLETMSDDELLAEAERAYQGFLDDLGRIREDPAPDYTSLTTWATDSFLQGVQEVYGENLPSGFTVEGAQQLLGIELAETSADDQSDVEVLVCVDNTTVVIRDSDDQRVQREGSVDRFWGRVHLVTADTGMHLQIFNESVDDSAGEELCDR